MKILAGVLVVAMALFAATALVGFFEQLRFYRHVRDHHYNLWLSLGGPDGLTPKQPAAFDFLRSGTYLTTGDTQLHALGNRVRRFWAAVAWQFALLVGLFLFLAAKENGVGV